MSALSVRFKNMFRVEMSDEEINGIAAMFDGEDACSFTVFIEKLCMHYRNVSHNMVVAGNFEDALIASLRVDTYEQILKMSKSISQCFTPDSPSVRQSK